MKKVNEYLPRRRSELDAWENNFIGKIAAIATELNYSSEEIAKINEVLSTHRDSYHAMNTTRQDAASAKANYKTKTVEALGFIRKLALNIKSNPRYNRSMGRALDIISTTV